MKGPRSAIGVALFLFLCAVYLLFYTGSYSSLDEMAVIAMADSLLEGRGFSADQLNWAQVRPGISADTTATVGEYGPDGRLYPKTAPGLAIAILPMVALAQQIDSLGAVQFAFLANILFTALSGIIIYLIGRRQGFGDGAAVTAALLFGLCTPALPYARTLFGESLSGLLILAAFGALTASTAEGRSRVFPVFLAGLLIGGAGLTRPLNFLFAPPFAGCILLQALSEPGGSLSIAPAARGLLAAIRHRWPQLLAFGLPVAGALTLYLLHNSARLGSPATTGYATAEGFRANPLTGLFILLLSPGKSIFLYAPLFLLLPPLWLLYTRRLPAAGLTILFAAILYIAALAFWMGSAGGWAWGPRLLMPLVPLLSLLLLPLAGAVRASRGWRAAAYLLIPLSLFVQLLGATVDYAESLRRLAGLRLLDGQGEVFKPTLAAHAQHIYMLRAGRADLGWLIRPDSGPVSEIDWVALWPLLLAVVVTGAALWAAMSGVEVRVMTGLLLCASLATPIAALSSMQRYQQTRLYRHAEVATVVEVLAGQGQPGDGLLAAAVAHSQPLQDLKPPGLALYGARNDSLAQMSPAVRARLDAFLREHRRLWLLLEWTPPGDPQSGLEHWLAGAAYPLGEWEVDGLRLALYQPGDTPAMVETDAHFGDDMLLSRYGFAPLSVRAGDALRVVLEWRARKKPLDDYTVSLQLLDGDGRLVAQADRQPAANTRPTASWQPGEVVIDRHGLLLPADLPPGQYTLQVALYSWPDLRRLPVDGAVDALVIGDVVVSGPD